jgi:hypothetical protein
MFAMHNPWVKVLVLACPLLILLVSGCASIQKGTVVSVNIQDNVSTVKGMVQKIVPEKGILIVASAKGDRVTLKFTERTPIKGGTISDIVRSNPVRVSYTVEGEQNMVVSIEILPQGSCH